MAHQHNITTIQPNINISTMSQKITPKSLSYTATLPPFLQRLHNSASNNGLDGRHEFAVARPKRARDTGADEEDEPAYVDEETNHTLSKEEYQALIAGDPPVEGMDNEEGPGNKEQDITREIGKEREKATIGATRKRKAVKIIGSEGGSDSEHDTHTNSTQVNSNTAKIIKESEGKSREGKKSGKEKVTVKSRGKAKGKKVKLSFGDDEG